MGTGVKKELSSTSRGTLFVLQKNEEMRLPYENALVPQNIRVVWFHQWENLLSALPVKDLISVVVDLDTLQQPFEPQFETLRTHFTGKELIALSSIDSAQLALQCLKNGFTDFLLKPTSPEEFAYTVRKVLQRTDIASLINDPATQLLRAVTQVSGGTTPTLVRIHALEYLTEAMGAQGALWANVKPESVENAKVLCSIPRREDAARLLFDVPTEFWGGRRPAPTVYPNDKKDGYRIIFQLKSLENELLLLWGLKKKPTESLLQSCLLLVEHAELSLLNIQKFEEVKQQTFVDDLTGLYNSRYLRYALTNSILRCQEKKQSFSVLFIDVDHFKKINDTHSHLVGSEFLVTIGRTIKNAVRRIDPVFRYGGDEFVVILNDTGLEGAREVAERIRKNIERRVFVIEGQRIQTTVSIGLASYPDHAIDREDLLRMADEAMYSAKRATRNAVHLAVEKPANA